MSLNIYTKQVIDGQTGQVIEQINIKKEVKNAEAFIRTYIEDLGALLKCPLSEQSIILALLKYIDYETNEVLLTIQRRIDLAEACNLKLSTVNVGLSRLIKKNILIKDRKNLFLNPKLFFYGSDLARTNMFRLNIDYQIKE